MIQKTCIVLVLCAAYAHAQTTNPADYSNRELDQHEKKTLAIQLEPLSKDQSLGATLDRVEIHMRFNQQNKAAIYLRKFCVEANGVKVNQPITDTQRNQRKNLGLPPECTQDELNDKFLTIVTSNPELAPLLTKDRAGTVFEACMEVFRKRQRDVRQMRVELSSLQINGKKQQILKRKCRML